MESLLFKFYTAFQDLDAETMVSYYHKDIHFHDPAFGSLQGERAKNMWRMLIASQKGKDFEVDFEIINENPQEGLAHWEAKYTFSKTGRRVHNRIKGRFIIKDGLIIEHKDEFNLHHWAAMAMGWKGRLFGRTAFFRKNLQKKTNKLLDNFESKIKNL